VVVGQVEMVEVSKSDESPYLQALTRSESRAAPVSQRASNNFRVHELCHVEEIQIDKLNSESLSESLSSASIIFKDCCLGSYGTDTMYMSGEFGSRSG
jgi:hypothetical protein